MNKLILSGHETFHCRVFWLKKGYDFIQQKGDFKESSAVVELGVGKNMVRAIKYWLTCFNIIDNEGKITKFGKFVFGKKGVDPYLEEISTIWLLHYYLVSKNDDDSIYSLFFNEFRKERNEFTQKQLLRFIQNKCREMNAEAADKTITESITVFLRNYLRPIKNTKYIEDDFTSLLMELEIIKELDSSMGEEKDKVYRIESSERPDIPIEIILFSILNNYPKSKSISFIELLSGENSIGNIYAMSSKGLYKKIDEITKKYPYIVFKDDAGAREIQIKKKCDPWKILRKYYEN